MKYCFQNKSRYFLSNLYSYASVFCFVLLFVNVCFSQKVAILTPEKNKQSEQFTKEFASSLSAKFNIIDLSLAESVLQSKEFETPFNLTNQNAKNLGVSIGCNFFIIIKTDTLRRTDFGRDEYYESFAAFYLVSSRTGRLNFWKLNKFEEDTPHQASSKLFASINDITNEISEQIKIAKLAELNEKDPKINELPEADSVDSKNFRPPLPYKRLKPKYTATASLYSLVATVDILVDIDENGEVLRTEIVRWAGYELDESVIETVKKMNWRPADRNGKTLPMRVLLRYNFKNIETEQ